MADHRDYADDPRQPSLFDVLAQPSARPEDAESEGGRVVEFPRRRDAQEVEHSLEPRAEATTAPVEHAPGPTGDAVVAGHEPSMAHADVGEPSGYLEPAPSVAPEDEWLTEIAPDLDEAELAMLAPVETEPRTQQAAGAPLAGPTLDDVVSRVWEGLVMRLPAACPVCHGEVLPAPAGERGGSCTSCGTAID